MNDIKSVDELNGIMKDYLPKYYHESEIVKELLQKESEEIFTIYTEIDDLLNNFYVDRATWGLNYFEEAYGIKIDESKPLDDRRSFIKARMRGVGTVTKTLIEQVASSYSYGHVTVIENPTAYQIVIKFTDTRGIPRDLDLIKNSLREIVPAHLVMLYEFTYLIWNELDPHTWNEIEAFNFDDLEVWDAL